MNRGPQMKKIAAWMRKGAYKALQISGIQEEKISKWINSWKEEWELEATIDYIKVMNAVAEALLETYSLHSEEQWRNLYLQKEMFPEKKVLNNKKLEMRTSWAQRPKFKKAKKTC